MRFYEARAEIQATPEVIWATLVDGPAYPTWDSGVQSVEGTIGPGETIKVTSEVNPKRAFPVKVADYEPPRGMTWAGGMPLGLFRGVRRFTLSPDGETTTFTMREEYTGPLLPLIWRSIPDLVPSFTQFAAGLKQRAERSR